MLTKVQRWGNSLALRIPKVFADELHLLPDAAIKLVFEDGKLIVIPIIKPVYSLEELLAEVTIENQHDEINSGYPVGKEAW